ncbi:MAG: ABC transporter ATP-binding protein [Rectinemataceae bacterium]|nr:ABC transporter ATP-binding protein [Spirochaetaceae bacterium]
MAETIVALDRVGKAYRLDEVQVEALKEVSLEIQAGDFVTIAGPSGSGKTTILNLIGCVDKPSSGIVTVLGRRTSELNDDELTELRHHAIGFIFQTFNLIPVLNIRENVELPLMLDTNIGEEERRQRREWVDFLIENVGLADRMRHRPAELSGGQRQRVAIARALVMKPALVLADEPTANLDSATGESILRLMRHMNETFGTTFIFSTHDPDIEHEADHVIRLRDGRIVENRRKSMVMDAAGMEGMALQSSLRLTGRHGS